VPLSFHREKYKAMMYWIVPLGDLLAIASFMFLSGFGIPYHDATTSTFWLTGYWLDTIPYLLIWIATGTYLDGSHHPNPYLLPWKRLFLRWSITAFVSGLLNTIVVRYILPDLYSQAANPGFPIAKSAFIIMLGWMMILGWRLTYKLFHWLSKFEGSKLTKGILIGTGIIVAAVCGLGLSINLYSNLHYSDRIITRNEAPARDLGIVFGAGVSREGVPSVPLTERVTTAVDLYHSGVLEKLLLSSGFSYGNSEAEIMMDMALELGVPRDALVIDTNGINTIQTCMNASTLKQDDNSIALITHEYHLPRAMMVCDLLGIHSVGVIAEQRYYPPQALFFWQVREFFASIYAFLHLIL
jgi:SanA protein